MEIKNLKLEVVEDLWEGKAVSHRESLARGVASLVAEVFRLAVAVGVAVHLETEELKRGESPVVEETGSEHTAAWFEVVEGELC